MNINTMFIKFVFCYKCVKIIRCPQGAILLVCANWSKDCTQRYAIATVLSTFNMVI